MAISFRQYEGTIIKSEKGSAMEMLEHVIEGCQCEGKRCTKCKVIRCHAVEILELRKQYQKTHAKHLRRYRKDRYQKLAEQFKEQKRIDYQERQQEIRERRRFHRKTNPEIYIAIDKAHFSRRRTRKSQAGGSFTPQQWRDLKMQYNFTCLCCGRREPEIKLTADHVIPITREGTSDISNIQPLCYSCNSKKHNKVIDYRIGKEHHHG
jgi:5-methylcytosine-specific restriction protein A